MASQLGTAYIKIAPDLTGVQGKISRELNGAIGDAGSKAGSVFGNSFSKLASDPIVQFGDKVLKGTLIAGAVAAGAAIIKNIGSAISRVDTLNNFPKVMSNIGISTEESSATIKALAKDIKGLPTALDVAALSVQRLTTKTKDVRKSKDIFVALNNAIIAGGAPMELQSSAMEQFSQSFAKGKPDMMEWRALTAAMPAQLDQLAKSMKFSSADELGEALRTGKVSMDDFASELVKLDKTGVDKFPSFAKQAHNAAGGLQTGMANMQTAIARGIANIIQTIGSDNITKAFTSIGEGFEGTLKTISDVITFIKENKDIFGPIIAGLAGFAIAAAAVAASLKIAAAAQALFNFALNGNPIVRVVTLLAGLTAGLAYFFTQTELGKAVWNGLVQFISTSILILVKIVIAAALVIANAFVTAFNTIKSVWSTVARFFGGVWNGIVAIFSGAAGWFGSIFNSAASAIRGAWNSITSWFGGVWNGIKNVFNSVGSWFKTNVVDSIVNAFNGIKDRIWKLFSGIWSGIGNSLKSIINSILHLPLKVPEIKAGGKTIIGGQTIIPALAKGGVVTGPTLAMIGEGRESEAVLPLSKLNAMLGNSGKGGAMINQTNNFYNADEPNMKKINSDLAWRLARI